MSVSLSPPTQPSEYSTDITIHCKKVEEGEITHVGAPDEMLDLVRSNARIFRKHCLTNLMTISTDPRDDSHTKTILDKGMKVRTTTELMVSQV